MPDFDPHVDDAAVFRPAAGVAAWILPGLGHILRGEKRRGGLIMFGVLFLIISGLLVGGVDCVDRQRDRLWFLAQSLNGPIAFAADFVNQSYVQKLPDAERYAATALNKPNEMGTLFIALAGLMNLVVILDAMFTPKRDEFINRRQPQNQSQNQPQNQSQNLAQREPPSLAGGGAPAITPSDSGAIT